MFGVSGRFVCPVCVLPLSWCGEWAIQTPEVSACARCSETPLGGALHGNITTVRGSLRVSPLSRENMALWQRHGMIRRTTLLLEKEKTIATRGGLCAFSI